MAILFCKNIFFKCKNFCCFEARISIEHDRMNDAIKLIPTKPDADLAAELKQEIIEAYKPALAILEKANKAGFVVQVSCGINCLGQMIITQLIIAKHY